jgi:uncharacterized protein (DUF362 family)
MTRVAIVKWANPVQMTVDALEMIQHDVDSVLHSKKPILIKLNYINSKHPSTGITTDSRVIEGIVKFLMERKKRKYSLEREAGLQTPFKPSKLLGSTLLLNGGV